MVRKLILVQCAKCNIYAQKDDSTILEEHWERTHRELHGDYQQPRDVDDESDNESTNLALTEEVSEGPPASRHQSQGGGGADTAAAPR